MQDYQDDSAVFKLLELGDPTSIGDWSIYNDLGITIEHLDELSQMAIDVDVLNSPTDDFWAGPIHAWRMLSQLGTEKAIAPLIRALQEMSQELWDWVGEEFPTAFTNIGPSAIPALADLIGNREAVDDSRQIAVYCITAIYQKYPDIRADAIAVLTKQLEDFENNDPDLNGALVSDLVVDFRAIESIDVIERAFDADCVNEAFMGDWGEVQVELGLKDRSEVPEKTFFNDMQFNPWEYYRKPESTGFVPGHHGKIPKTKAKSKRQAQSASRRKNRSKKK